MRFGTVMRYLDLKRSVYPKRSPQDFSILSVLHHGWAFPGPSGPSLRTKCPHSRKFPRLKSRLSNIPRNSDSYAMLP